MTTFIVVGDIHWSGRTPMARADHFPTAMAAKLREVHNIAREFSAAAILQPGDMTDSIGIGYGAFQDLAKVIGESPCPWISIPGNHDREGGNPATDLRSPWGALVATDVMQEASGQCYPASQKGSAIVVTGHGYDHETDIDKNQYGRDQNIWALVDGDPLSGANDHNISIHLAHGMLLKAAPGIDSMRHTLVSEIAELPNAPDVLICGHYHLPLGIIRVGKTMIINPGALCRLSAHIEEIERTVQVAILQIGDGGWIDAELRPIQCAQPGNVVLSRQHIEEAADRELRLTRFLDLLQGEQEQRQTDLVGMIDDIGKRELLPEVVKAEALRRLAAAQETLAVAG